MKEYVIWGIPPKQTEETLLLTSVQGNKITTRTKAEQYQLVSKRKWAQRRPEFRNWTFQSRWIGKKRLESDGRSPAPELQMVYHYGPTAIA